ncbi:MAG: hypothetical protein AAFY15_12670 [Cyanobacteria bacterium J06648_11]
MGLEFIDIFGLSILLTFEVGEDKAGFQHVDEVLRRLLTAPVLQSIWVTHSVVFSGVTGARNYKSYMRQPRSKLTRAWQRGQMSNFEDFLHLNLLAGRSFNDLT